jgi:DNA-binding response OmpR family regulator
MRDKKLLVVEDDFQTQEFLRLLLNKYYEIDICKTSNEFYALINKNKYDLIIMDISIKGEKDGLQLTKEIKSNPATSKIPVLCLSAHVFMKDKINALTAGVDLFLQKPVENHVLLDSIEELISKFRSS